MKADDAGKRSQSGVLQQNSSRTRTTERDMQSLQLIEEILETIDLDEPVVRPEVVAAARVRLAEGYGPTAHDLADLLVDELSGDLQLEPHRAPRNH